MAAPGHNQWGLESYIQSYEVVACEEVTAARRRCQDARKRRLYDLRCVEMGKPYPYVARWLCGRSCSLKRAGA